ncbi:PREDICTED: natural killer cells antigen CD94-like [Condylura cristata]|uniref:natural killer cells antigen CD94-like n=1 Tax=Condylura cristata TaxID=143302 RepID=UPI0003347AD0|nr:PREDICTED: natural killer cells antigen CD94-like [Condylura cristata]
MVITDPSNCPRVLALPGLKVMNFFRSNFLVKLGKRQCDIDRKLFISLYYNSTQSKWFWLDGTDFTQDSTVHPSHQSVGDSRTLLQCTISILLLTLLHNFGVPKQPSESMLRPRSSGKTEPSPRRPGAPSAWQTSPYLSFSTVPQTTIWRWITGILGVTCLLLMAILGIVLKQSFHKPSTVPTISPGYSTEIQKDSGYRSCPERWIGHRCNCYFISSESRTWNESREICASQNSTLLQMHNKDELHFMKLNHYYYWIGATYSAEHGAWMWLNGSVVSLDLFPFFQKATPKNCIVYSPKGNALGELCRKKNLYICKQQMVEVEEASSEGLQNTNSPDKPAPII